MVIYLIKDSRIDFPVALGRNLEEVDKIFVKKFGQIPSLCVWAYYMIDIMPENKAAVPSIKDFHKCERRARASARFTHERNECYD